jgi:hypothetical protein
MTTPKEPKRFPKGDPREGMTSEEWHKTLPVYEPGMTIAVSFPKGTGPKRTDQKEEE